MGLHEDIAEIKQDVKDIKDKVYDYHGRVSKLESGQSAVWWVLAVGSAMMLALLGYIKFS